MTIKPIIASSALIAVLAMAGCSQMMNTPTAQSVAGLSPSGNVTITEDFVTGLGGGRGTLEYQRRTYPFEVVGTVAGPGGGLEKISASGPVYKLASVSDFPGRYTQSTGKAGLSSSGSSDFVAGEQRGRDHAFARYEQRRDADPREGRDLHSDGSVLDSAGGRYVKLHVNPEAISGSDPPRAAAMKSSKDCN